MEALGLIQITLGKEEAVNSVEILMEEVGINEPVEKNDIVSENEETKENKVEEEKMLIKKNQKES